MSANPEAMTAAIARRIANNATLELRANAPVGYTPTLDDRDIATINAISRELARIGSKLHAIETREDVE